MRIKEKIAKISEYIQLSRGEVLIYLLLSVLVLIVLNTRGLLLDFLGAKQGVTVNIKPLTEELTTWQEKVSTPMLVLIWAGIGSIYYFFVYFVRTGISFERQNKQFKSQMDNQPVTSIVERKLEKRLFFKTLIWSLIYLLVFFRWLLPLATTWFYHGIFASGYIHPAYLILGATAFNTVTLMVLFKSLRLLRASWQPINPLPAEDDPIFQ